jgi:TPP-dependent indolepyruvate ferredoxin oxidoreductase alpha subunit
VATNPTLGEIVSALTAATERRDLEAMASGAAALAAYTGEAVAALVMCVPTIRLALDPTTQISRTERMAAEHAARAILDLTGIDPAKEG